MDYLSKREYSYVELAQKLKPYAASELENNDEYADFEINPNDFDDKIKVILDDFKQRGWLSDERYAEQMSHARQRKFGSQRIANELRQKGVADEVIAEAIESAQANDLDNARVIWQKKYGQAPKDRNEWAKQARFLQGRGFGFDIIKRIIAESAKDDDE